jgi:hypothetical protein
MTEERTVRVRFTVGHDKSDQSSIATSNTSISANLNASTNNSQSLQVEASSAVPNTAAKANTNSQLMERISPPSPPLSVSSSASNNAVNAQPSSSLATAEGTSKGKKGAAKGKKKTAARPKKQVNADSGQPNEQTRATVKKVKSECPYRACKVELGAKRSTCGERVFVRGVTLEHPGGVKPSEQLTEGSLVRIHGRADPVRVWGLYHASNGVRLCLLIKADGELQQPYSSSLLEVTSIDNSNPPPADFSANVEKYFEGLHKQAQEKKAERKETITKQLPLKRTASPADLAPANNSHSQELVSEYKEQCRRFERQVERLETELREARAELMRAKEAENQRTNAMLLKLLEGKGKDS